MSKYGDLYEVVERITEADLILAHSPGAHIFRRSMDSLHELNREVVADGYIRKLGYLNIIQWIDWETGTRSTRWQWAPGRQAHR